MATSQYSGLYQHRAGTITLEDGKFYSPRLNSNGELIVDATVSLGSTIFEFNNSDAAAVVLVDSNGDALPSPLPTNPRGTTTGGNSVFNSTDLDESAEQVKATAGTIYAAYVWNLTDTPLWLKAFNVVGASVTVGVTSANYDIMIPANANSDGAGFALPIPTGGWPFSTAITLAVTTGRGVTNSGAPGDGAAGVLVFYV